MLIWSKKIDGIFDQFFEIFERLGIPKILRKSDQSSSAISRHIPIPKN